MLESANDDCLVVLLCKSLQPVDEQHTKSLYCAVWPYLAEFQCSRGHLSDEKPDAQTESHRCAVLTCPDVCRGVPDASVDTVVTTFMFCVLPEELIPKVLSEIVRVLRPGGTMRLADIQVKCTCTKTNNTRFPTIAVLEGAAFCNAKCISY